MIHVCFGVYDKDGRYSKFAGTTIASIFDNTTSEVTIHILHDNTMTLANYEKFVYLAGKYGQQIKFYNVEKICADKIAELKNKFPAVESARVTIGTMYRLLMADIFPDVIKKIIYLDSDMIVNLDIKDLWQVELNDRPLAAVAENEADPVFFKNVSRAHYLINEKIVAYEDYFNAAVMFINLERLRKEKETLQRGIKFLVEHPQCISFDQDILNYCFTKEYVHLSSRFDRFITSERAERKPPRDVIYHFTGPNPTPDFRDPLNRLYFDYFVKTPWFNAESISHIYDGVRQIQHELQSRTIWMSKVMAGRQRAFFVPPNNLEPMKKVFGVDDNDEVILAIGMESLQQLIDSMKKSKGAKLYFILTAQFPGVQATLTREGFKDGRDFVNGLIFLSEAHGVPMNSYPLIKAL